MIRDITLGQYYPSDSVIHRLDPRVKIIGTFVYLIGLFMIDTFWGFLFSALFLEAIILTSKVPLRFVLKGLKPIMFLLVITFILNLFMFDGEILFRWKFISITDQGLYKASFMGIRLFLIIISSYIMTLTTKPINLTDGIEHLLKPFDRIKVPSHEIALMMSIALRFIPTLLEETDKIMKAQISRGADFETGNIFRRAKSLVPILIPLFLSAFRIALDLAMAMEARCYQGGDKRTRMKPMKYMKKDYLAYMILLIFIALVFMEEYLI